MPQAGPFLCSSYSIGSFARRVQVRQAVPTPQTQAQYEYYRRTGTTESARTFFPHLPENRDTILEMRPTDLRDRSLERSRERKTDD